MSALTTLASSSLLLHPLLYHLHHSISVSIIAQLLLQLHSVNFSISKLYTIPLQLFFCNVSIPVLAPLPSQLHSHYISLPILAPMLLRLHRHISILQSPPYLHHYTMFFTVLVTSLQLFCPLHGSYSTNFKARPAFV